MERYDTETNALDRKLAAGYEPEELPGYLDSGGSADIFQIDNGAQVVKIPRLVSEKGETPQEVVERYVTAYERGQGQLGFEQMSAYRLKQNPRVVCQYIEAKTFEDLTLSERSEITPHDYDALFAAYEKMPYLGIEDDRSPRNLLYSPTDGFIIIDYEATELASRHFTVEDRIMGFATEILTNGISSGQPLPSYIRVAHETIVSEIGTDLGRIISTHWKQDGLQLK